MEPSAPQVSVFQVKVRVFMPNGIFPPSNQTYASTQTTEQQKHRIQTARISPMDAVFFCPLSKHPTRRRKKG